MGLDDFIEGEESNDGESNEQTEETSNSSTGSNTSDKEGPNLYKEYADLDEELDPEVASIVDEVVEEWTQDNMVEVRLQGEDVVARRADLVYGIVNIVKRTQHYFDNKD